MIEEKKMRGKEVELEGSKYLIYLKEVPTRITPEGTTLKTTTRAFVKKLDF